MLYGQANQAASGPGSILQVHMRLHGTGVSVLPLRRYARRPA